MKADNKWFRTPISSEYYSLERVENKTNIPYVIYGQYETLLHLYDQEEYFGALYQIKDVLEIALKFPLLIMLGIVVKNVEESGEPICLENLKVGNSGYKNLNEYLCDILSGEISFGKLEQCAKGLASMDLSSAPSKYDKEFIVVRDILRKIVPAYYHAKFLGSDTKTISNWRNKVIGHGALNANKDMMKKALEPIFMNLNAVMRVSDYSKLNIVQRGKSYLIWARNDENPCTGIEFIEGAVLNLNSYITLNEETGLDFDARCFESSFLFESYNNNKERATVLDYINNEKRKDENLSLLLRNVAKKICQQSLKPKEIIAGNVDESTQKAIMDIYPKEIMPLKPFYDVTRELLAKEKGILVLRSERGTGKTIFSRTIINNYDKEQGDNYRIYYDENKYGDIKEQLLRDDDLCEELYTCVYNMNNSWMYTVSSFTNTLMKSLNPQKYDHTKYAQLSSNFVHMLNHRDELLKNKSIREYKSDVSSAFNDLVRETLDIYRSDACIDEAKLLIVFDGLDELPNDENVVRISEFLNKTTLPKNIYILILARTEAEWKLPDDIIKCGFEEKELTKGCFHQELINYAQIHLPSKLNSSEFINTIIKEADCRILYLQLVCDFFSLQSSIEYNGILSSIENLPQTFVEAFQSISRRYYKDLKTLVAVFSLTDQPLTLNELYNLYGGDIAEKVDYSFYALLYDIRGFLAVYRINKVNKYAIGNEAWKKSLSCEYFEAARAKIKENIFANVESILTKNAHWLDSDTHYLKMILSINSVNLKCAKMILEYIDECFENITENFSVNFNKYVNIVFEIRRVVKDFDVQLYAQYLFVQLQSWVNNEYENYIVFNGNEGLYKFFNYNIGYLEFPREKSITPYDIKSPSRLLYLLAAEIKSKYYYSCKNVDIMIGNYALALTSIETWMTMISSGITINNGDLLYDMISYLRSVPCVEHLKCERNLDENHILERLHSVLDGKYDYHYRLTKKQFELFDYAYYGSDMTHLDIHALKRELLDDANSVAESNRLTKQEKSRYFRRLLNFFSVIKTTSKIYRKQSVLWKRMLRSNKRIPYKIVSKEYLNHDYYTRYVKRNILKAYDEKYKNFNFFGFNFYKDVRKRMHVYIGYDTCLHKQIKIRDTIFGRTYLYDGHFDTIIFEKAQLMMRYVYFI